MPDGEVELQISNHSEHGLRQRFKIIGAKTRLFEYMEKPKRAKRGTGMYESYIV